MADVVTDTAEVVRARIGVYIGIIYAVLSLLCIAIVNYYAEPNFPWHSKFTIFLGYYASFGILLLVPIDMAACIIDRRPTGIHIIFDDDHIRIQLSTICNASLSPFFLKQTYILNFNNFHLFTFSENNYSVQQYGENSKTLSSAYGVFFWIIFVLGSFILVYEEYFNTDGHFSECVMNTLPIISIHFYFC